MYHHDARDIEEYVTRMKDARQFKMFGIEPQWAPGTGDIEGFCHDEVIRQFHNTKVKSDGGVRVEWMLSAWQCAQRQAAHGLPTVDDILALGKLVEPHQNSLMGFRTGHVKIGGSYGAHPAKLKEFVPALVTRAADVEPVQGRKGPHPDDYRSAWEKFEDMIKRIVTADDWYLAYEAVHPFADGNGRTGKILFNWLLGSLDDPILVDDYFGGANP